MQITSHQEEDLAMYSALAVESVPVSVVCKLKQGMDIEDDPTRP